MRAHTILIAPADVAFAKFASAIPLPTSPTRCWLLACSRS